MAVLHIIIRDDYIYGFSHTHLSGTGVSDYGDILITPLNKEVVWNNGADGKAGYGSRFSHDREVAHPGYYSVYLEDPKVQAELTTSDRGGVHKYTFKESNIPGILIDLIHRDEVLSSSIKVVSPTRIEGHRRSSAWATDQHVYFAAEFSEPITDHLILYGENEMNITSASGNKIKAYFQFNTNIKTLEIKVAISAVDVEGAWKNFNEELEDRTFSEIQTHTDKLWNIELNKITAQFNSKDEKVIFYSALYHSMLAPNLYMDVDGRYRDMDLGVYQSEDHVHYTVFSLWDTYRAAHPLYTIIDQKRTTDYIRTFIKKHESGGVLPIWDLSACYTGCMIGNHAVPVIADAYVKGIRGFGEYAALDAMVHATTLDRLGLSEYKNKGFISVENEPESVSKVLEYSYDDYCVGIMAKELGRPDLAQTHFNRSLNYRNIFDPSSGFFRGRMHNTWQSPFDPYEVNNNYTEANAWQYGYYVPHDMSGFINLHGGVDMLDQRLDNLFSAKVETSGRDQSDITGLIGQYAHGNEPSHHIAYLYNFLSKPWKSQKWVREIMDSMYQNEANGISGNEDCGQMSAWYVFSALGFYPVTPGTPNYVIGSPLVKSGSINLENGKSFRVVANNNIAENPFIQSATLNGAVYTKSFITHDDIMNGGELVFEMGPNPNENWGVGHDDIPITMVGDDAFIAPPIISGGKTVFTGATQISFDASDKSNIFYQINDGSFFPYQNELVIESNCSVSVYSSRNGKYSDTLETHFYKIEEGRSIRLVSEYARQYHAGGDFALIDGLRGTQEYRTGVWQGYEGQDLECIVDLGKIKSIESIACGFLQDENAWIFMPSSVSFFTSKDGEKFEHAGTVETETPQRQEGKVLEYFKVTNAEDIRYVKMIARSLMKCPDWHKGFEYDGNAWIFADEIIVE